jgi:hypothetical protein
MTCAKTAIFFTLLWIAIAYVLTEDAYTVGYEQGYAHGYVRGNDAALLSPQALQTCTKWWFDGSEARAKQAMNQYCERNKK